MSLIEAVSQGQSSKSVMPRAIRSRESEQVFGNIER